ncbi:MAG: GTPase Era [Bacteroidia bacterium]|nr:GTPase Era [Bacteroidia bacterium]
MSDRTTETESPSFRCGYVALIGAPNAGKSTFLNAVLGTKLSIVTAKPQTTRRRLLGFYTTESSQILFIDTPGLIKPRYVLQEAMVNSALTALKEADAVLLIIDAARALERRQVFPEGLIPLLEAAPGSVFALLNKVDLVRDKKQLLPLMQAVHEAFRFKAIIPASALEADGLDAVLRELESALPKGPPMYPDDQLSDQPERFFVSEIIREKIFEQFREEVPYATEVYITEFKEGDDKDFISAEIVVERESQRRIIIGTKGQAIKAIGSEARRDIEEFIGRQVFLDLHVRIREGWRDDKNWVRRMGYTD